MEKHHRLIITGADLFTGQENPFSVMRYHSLVVEKESLPDELEVTATSQDDRMKSWP